MKDEFYVMPEIHVGQTVCWYHDPGASPAAAVVTAAGTRTVSLNIHLPEHVNCMCVEGVVHKTDPQAPFSVENDTGIWDYSVWDKKLLGLLTGDVEEEELPDKLPPAPRKMRGRPRKEVAEATS